MALGRATLIFNPCSGRAATRQIAEKVKTLLAAANWESDQCETAGPGDAVHLAQEAASRSNVIIAIGGDGTVNEVASGVYASGGQTAVAIIPAGTANVVAAELGLPKQLEDLVAVAIAGKQRLFDLGKAEDASGGRRFFIMCAGAGLDGEIVADVSRRRGRRGITMMTYYLPTLGALWRYRFPQIAVSVDGQLRENNATFVIVGNLRRYGGPFAFFADADPQDGLLDVCCLRSRSRARFIYCGLIAAWRKSLAGLKEAVFYRGRAVALTSAENVLVQMDGDPRGSLPLRLEALPSAVCFKTPL